MSNASIDDKRQQAQDNLTATQDHWISVVSRHGADLSNAEVLLARRQLELARMAYLSLGRVKEDC